MSAVFLGIILTSFVTICVLYNRLRGKADEHEKQEEKHEKIMNNLEYQPMPRNIKFVK